MIKQLDGIILGNMFQNGYNNLCNREAEINELNVFPVADGDTGTNMRLTLEHGLSFIKAPIPAACDYLKALNDGMLMGARGNSGVILSQIIKGIYTELARQKTISIAGMRNAFISGYREAYRSVSHPAEGTILTVARESIENIRRQLTRNTSFEAMFSMYLSEMKKSLDYTPNLLDVLKQAGVIDSGAYGYYTIVEGMTKYLYGEKITVTAHDFAEQKHSTATTFDEAFGEHSEFKLGYCTEFLLQRMSGERYLKSFDLSAFREELEKYGTSLVAVEDEKRIKVHIHTFTPDKVIETALRYGEFLSFKLENMQLQHNGTKKQQPTDDTGEQKPLGIIAVTDGEPIAELMTELGCDRILDCGPSMNVSAGDFTECFDSVNAKSIAVLPNNKNTAASAMLAASLYKGDKKITVIPTKSIFEGYSALAMDMPDSDDVDYRLSQMNKAIKDSHTLYVTVSSKDYQNDEITVKKGQNIAVIDDRVVCGSDDRVYTVISGISRLIGLTDRETLILFKGAGTDNDFSDEVENAVNTNFPQLEVNTVYGGQNVYQWIIGIL